MVLFDGELESHELKGVFTMKKYTIHDAINTHLARKWEFSVEYTDSRIILHSEVGGTFIYDKDGVLLED